MLMADEPTGNLDGATGIEVAELMFRLNREHGTTLLLVTHDVNLASRCERRLSLALGRLVGDERVEHAKACRYVRPARDREMTEPRAARGGPSRERACKR